MCMEIYFFLVCLAKVFLVVIKLRTSLETHIWERELTCFQGNRRLWGEVCLRNLRWEGYALLTA